MLSAVVAADVNERSRLDRVFAGSIRLQTTIMNSSIEMTFFLS